MIPIAAPDIGPEEKRGVLDVLDDGQLTDGPVVRAFEEEFADYCDADHGVATVNGTAALHAALEAVGVGPGDAVVTTPFTFIATANAIRLAGATPVFADIDPDTYNLDPDAVEAVVRERDDVAAILAVHLYGLPARMDHLADVAEDHDLSLVEDAAQAHGAEFRGQRVGSFGDAAAFSFYPTKNMTSGEGGMITTDRDDVATAAARYVDHGRTDTYEHAAVGHNYRLPSLAAAIGRAQLDRLPSFVDARRENARQLRTALSETAVSAPVEPDYAKHAYHQFTVRTDRRNRLQEHLREHGVGSRVYYPIPVHHQPAYADVAADAPEAERAADEVLSLPVHPGLSEGDVETIAAAVAAFRRVTQ
ncbi:DegT/DnrJ/EryC1/StrS family aminotransferase [Halobacteriaceae archaeon GCM10025711]